jgi:hypothetical protein
VSAWGRGLKSLGRTTVSASLSLGKKSISVVTLGAVASHPAAPRGPPEPPIPRVWSARDFGGGARAVSREACGRVANAAALLRRLDALVALAEAGGPALAGSGPVDSIRRDVAARLREQVTIDPSPFD